LEIRELVLKVKDIANESSRKEIPNTPVYVGLLRPYYAERFGVDLIEYFNDPELCLRTQLMAKIFKHENVPDDSVIKPVIGLDFATTLEASLFGVESIYRPGQEPCFGAPVIKEKSDLDKLELPDFYRSGIMPQVHRTYERMQELVDGELEVSFPGWARGPWSVACMLRGFTEIYIDLMEDPDFVHRLMQFLVKAKLHYEEERAKFLGLDMKEQPTWKYIYMDYREVGPSDLYNDEVDGALFSVDTYREFIFPYEKQIAEFYGGCRYYHSCGKMDTLLPQVGQLPGIKIVHVSAWTDVAKARAAVPEGTTLQVVMHVQDDVMDATESHIRERLMRVVEACRGVPFMICADTISSGPIEKVQEWLAIAREVLEEAKLPDIPAATF
jgi:uroporphyrinogen-III decarboxylase